LTLNDLDFLDLIYSQWAKTSGGDNTFWMPIEDKDYPGRWNIAAVDKDENRQMLGEFWSETDADFVCGLHGCIADLVRRMHAALDEADRVDRERDEQEQSIYALAVENEELKQEIATLRRQQEMAVSRAGDVLWKIERPM
jgi:hypothetical protein